MPKFVRVAQSGKTIDGREITPEMLTQAADQYDPEVYGARINLEHIRAYAPDSVFKSYGDVIALKTEKKGDDVVLLAQLEPTPELVELNKQKQKIYSSVELTPDFKGKGSWYLSGLAVTDSPASLGTEALKFSAGKKAEMLSAYSELDLEKDDVSREPEKDDSRLFSRIKRLLSASGDENTVRFSDHEKTIVMLSDDLKTTREALVALTDRLQAETEETNTVKGELKKLGEDFSALKASLEREEGGKSRPEFDGTNGALLTDC